MKDKRKSPYLKSLLSVLVLVLISAALYQMVLSDRDISLGSNLAADKSNRVYSTVYNQIPCTPKGDAKIIRYDDFISPNQHFERLANGYYLLSGQVVSEDRNFTVKTPFELITFKGANSWQIVKNLDDYRIEFAIEKTNRLEKPAWNTEKYVWLSEEFNKDIDIDIGFLRILIDEVQIHMQCGVNNITPLSSEQVDYLLDLSNNNKY